MNNVFGELSKIMVHYDWIDIDEDELSEIIMVQGLSYILSKFNTINMKIKKIFADTQFRRFPGIEKFHIMVKEIDGDQRSSLEFSLKTFRRRLCYSYNII